MNCVVLLHGYSGWSFAPQNNNKVSARLAWHNSSASEGDRTSGETGTAVISILLVPLSEQNTAVKAATTQLETRVGTQIQGCGRKCAGMRVSGLNFCF